MRLNIASKFRAFAFASTLLTAALASGVAHAGELKFGEGPSSLETDDKGKLTGAGSKTAVKELDKVIGEDAWDLKVWARVDRGVAGPMYIEFYQTVNGQKSIVHRHEMEFEGGKHFTESVMLEGSQGFNKNRNYQVVVIQNDGKKDIKLAEGKIKLIKTDRKEEDAGGGGGDKEGGESGGGEGGGEGGGDSNCSEQDRLDGFCEDGGGGGGGGGADTPAPDAEPPATTDPATKKGCAITSHDAGGHGALLLLLVAGAGLVRRRVR
jgi:MYXO-CTERM domain-containing protein